MPHAFDQDDVATRLAAYLDASPSPFHAVESTASLLEGAGFTRVAEVDPTPTDPGHYLTLRGGSLIAWSTSADLAPHAPFRIVGAHTDSPNLRVKPRPDVTRAGWQQVAVEVYGGPLLNSWLDRDLGLSGRVAVRSGAGFEGRLLLLDEPLLRVSQLAPHLDRSVNTDGLKLNPQQHLVPHWGQGDSPGDLASFLAERLEVTAEDILGWDLMTHDLTPARRIGRDADLLASARLDNLATSFAATLAIASAVDSGVSGVVPVIALFDHEEVGSTTERGAQSTFLAATLERIVLARGGSREDYLRALAGTVIASGDMAHTTNPNYSERHEPGHHITMNGGPVLKINAQARYATDALGAAAFRLACEQASVPVQTFVTRTDLPCGSTVGPVTSALTGATTVDFGAPTLSMHSTREACGVADQAMYAGALEAFLSPT